MEPIEARAAEVGCWYTNAKGIRVQVKAILPDGVLVEKAPGQSTTVPLTYPLTPETTAPAAAPAKAADLAGRPKPQVEAALQDLPTGELQELLKLDSRIWLGVEVKKLLAKRAAEEQASGGSTSSDNAAAPAPDMVPTPTFYCIVCSQEVAIRKPMTVRLHSTGGSTCLGTGTLALDHLPTEADRMAEDEVGEKAWRDGYVTSAPDIDEEGRPRPLAAAGWDRARTYWQSLEPEPKIRSAPTEDLALQTLEQFAVELDLDALERLQESAEMEQPVPLRLMEALRQAVAKARAVESSAATPLEMDPTPVQALGSQDAAAVKPGPVAGEPASNTESASPDPMADGPAEFPPPMAQDNPKYVRVLNWMGKKLYRVTEGRPMPGSTTDRRVRVIAAAQAKVADAKLVLQHPDAKADPEILRWVAEYEMEQGARRTRLVTWIERQLGEPIGAGRATVTICDADLAAAAAAYPAPSAGLVLSVPDRDAVVGFQAKLQRLQECVKELRELVPYVVAANQLCEEAGDLGLVIDMDDLIACDFSLG